MNPLSTLFDRGRRGSLRTVALIAIMALGLATAWTVSAVRYEGSADTLDRAEDLRVKLTQQALSSDPRARLHAGRVLDDLTAFLRRAGKTFAEAKADFGQSQRVAGHLVGIDAVAPFYVKVHNTPNLDDIVSLNAYVADRRASLERVAPDTRQVSVGISPAGHLTLEDFLELARQHGVRVTELSVDVAVDGQWKQMIWASDKGEGGRDFSVGAASIREQLIGPLLRLPPSAQRGVPAGQLSGARLEIRYAEADASVAAAQQFQRSPRIQLVDVINDFLDPFANSAASVTVGHMPQVYVTRHLLTGTWYPTSRNTAEAPATPADARDRSAGGRQPRPLFSGWAAWDTNNDDPDSAHKIFAPYSYTHNSAWWNNDGAYVNDLLLDDAMQWETAAPQWFYDRRTDNLVHEVRANHYVYEATDWISSSLPGIDHNEDDLDGEESQQGYEEKEVGMTQPENLIANTSYYLYTEYYPMVNDASFFDSESEMTGWLWNPLDWDQLGGMYALGTW